MKASKPYFLNLTLSSGKVVKNAYSTRRLALEFAGRCLDDNCVATKREAQDFAAALVDGEAATHRGYTLMVEPAHKGTPTRL